MFPSLTRIFQQRHFLIELNGRGLAQVSIFFPKDFYFRYFLVTKQPWQSNCDTHPSLRKWRGLDGGPKHVSSEWIFSVVRGAKLWCVVRHTSPWLTVTWQDHLRAQVTLVSKLCVSLWSSGGTTVTWFISNNLDTRRGVDTQEDTKNLYQKDKDIFFQIFKIPCPSKNLWVCHTWQWQPL